MLQTVNGIAFQNPVTKKLRMSIEMYGANLYVKFATLKSRNSITLCHRATNQIFFKTSLKKLFNDAKIVVIQRI